MNERWWLVIGGWLVYAVYYVGRVNFSVAVPDMAREMDLTAGQVGAVSGAFFWVYALAGVGAGWLADRHGARWLVGLGLVGSGVMNIAFVGSNSFGIAALIWGLNGLFQAMGWSPLIGGVSRWMSEERGRAAGAVFGTSFVAGTAIALVVGGQLLERSGFDAVFEVAGIVLIVVGGVWCLSVKDDPAAAPSRLRPVEASGATLRMAVPLAAIGVAYVGLLVWTPFYLVDAHGLSVPSASTASAAVLGFAAVTTMAITPAFRHGSSGAVAGLLATTAAGLALVGIAWSPSSGLVLLGLATVLVSASSSVLLGVFPRLIDVSRAAAIGGGFALAFNVGGGLGSPIIGSLIEGASWLAVFGTMAVCALVGAMWMGSLHSIIPTSRVQSPV